MIWPTTLTILLLACQLWSAYGGSSELLRRGEAVERTLRRSAMARVEERVERRQTSNSDNSTAWDVQTTAACMASLMMLNGTASNPAGMAICYNLPFLDNSTGIFQADLRVYQVMAPTGDFAGVAPGDVQVSLKYAGAVAQSVDPSQLQPIQGRSVLSTLSRRDWARTKRRATMSPTMLQDYGVVGKINADLMYPNMNASALQALLIPIVTLNATNPAGVTVTTTLSSDDATFVSGIFSDAANATSAAAAAASASAAASALIAAQPFQMPGTTIAIFPVGAIVTGVWASLGVAIVIYGTIGRMKFRELYRRRVARVETRGVVTI